jgi:hypothetical protein
VNKLIDLFLDHLWYPTLFAVMAIYFGYCAVTAGSHQWVLVLWASLCAAIAVASSILEYLVIRLDRAER